MSNPTLQKGSSGPAVAKLQNLLNQRTRPSPDLTVDSDFGNKTKNAVVGFQASQGLLVDGIVGPCTWAALEQTEIYSIGYPIVLVPQRTQMTCWSASASMLKGSNSTPGSGSARLDPTGGLIDTPANLLAFANSHGLILNYGQSWTVAGLANLMQTYGPLMLCAVLPTFKHCVVIGGLRGDGTQDGTTLRIYDPAPVDSGTIYPIILGATIRRFPLLTSFILHRSFRFL